MAFDQKAYHKQWCKDHPERVKAYKDRSLKKHPQKKRRSENVPAYRLYAYRAWDKKHGFTDTLSKEEAVEAMMMECTYCGLLPANGLIGSTVVKVIIQTTSLDVVRSVISFLGIFLEKPRPS